MAFHSRGQCSQGSASTGLSMCPLGRGFPCSGPGEIERQNFLRELEHTAACPECWSRKALQSLLVKQRFVSCKILSKSSYCVAVSLIFIRATVCTKQVRVKISVTLIFYNRIIPMEMCILTHPHTDTSTTSI